MALDYHSKADPVHARWQVVGTSYMQTSLCSETTQVQLLFCSPPQYLCNRQHGLQSSGNVCCVRPAGVVKMRRGQVASFMLQVQSMKEVYQIFHQSATIITLKYALKPTP